MVHVGAGVAPPGPLTNTVTIDATTADTVGGNNSATENTAVVAAPTATPTVTFTPTTTSTPTGALQATLAPTATPSPTATATSTPTPSPTPFAITSKDEKEDKAKETEDQQRQRERTNRSGRDEYATEGNVIAVDAAASPPTITIANRDGVVVLVWTGPRDQFPSVKVGDYIQVDGEKVTEQLYEITDVSAD